MMMNTRDDAGDLNFIPAGQAMTDAYISGKINEADTSKRWYPIKGFKNVDQPVGDPTTETFDGIDEIVEDGVETFTGVRTKGNGDPKFKKMIDSRQCIDTSVFEITVAGELVGEALNGDLYPIKIETGTMNTRYIKPTQAAVQKLQFDFAVSKLVYTGNYKYISADQFEVSLLTYVGLQDILASTSGISQTTVTIALKGCFGPWGQEKPFSGLLLGDWSLFNQTDQLAVAITTAVEIGTSGVYDLTFPSQDVSDIMEYDFTKAGFELAEKPGEFVIV